MSRSRLLLIIGTAAITTSVFLSVVSCHKKKDDTTTSNSTEENTLASDQSFAEKTFDEAQNIADVANDAGSGKIYRTTQTTLSGCATVTHTPGHITIDFGSVNCLCVDGRYRRGKINVAYSGTYAASGSTHTITFDSFYVNNNKVEGSRTVTNMGTNSAGQMYFNITVDGTVTRVSGATIHHESNRVRTWIDGSATPDRFDDVYSVTGGGTVTRTSALGGTTTATISIMSPLIVAMNCDWIEAGTISQTIGTHTRTLNYGTTASCDSLATFTTASGATVVIGLP
jgi:hypothetical protein